MHFPNPARPGDLHTMTSECIEKRESQSNSNHGIVCTIVEITNQEGEAALTLKSTFIVARQTH
jgi:acyl dehydratase